MFKTCRQVEKYLIWLSLFQQCFVQNLSAANISEREHIKEYHTQLPHNQGSATQATELPKPSSIPLQSLPNMENTPNSTPSKAKPVIPKFNTKRDELLYWATQNGNENIVQTHLAEVAVCTLVKDEHLDILEWIQYHRFIGIGKFYLYDNNSNPPMIYILQSLLNRGIVEYQYINDTFLADDYFIFRKKQQLFRQKFQKKKPHVKSGSVLNNSVQVWAITNCVTNYRARHKWIALLDVDEFLFFPDKHPTKDPPHLPTFLNDYIHAGGLVVYRKHFGSSGHIERPTNGVLASYTKCSQNISDETRQFYPKVILNTQFFKQGGECRVHECSSTRKMMTTQKKWVHLRWFQSHWAATWDKLIIHHYFTKSFQDFRLKQQRGMPHSRGSNKCSPIFRPDYFFYFLDNITTTNCTQGIEYSGVCCRSAVKQSQLIFRRFMYFHREQMLKPDDIQKLHDGQKNFSQQVVSNTWDLSPMNEKMEMEQYVEHSPQPI